MGTIDILQQMNKDHESEMKRYDDIIEQVKELNFKVKALVDELQWVIDERTTKVL